MADDLTRRQVVRRAAFLACLPALAKSGCARRIDIDRSVAVPLPVDGALRVPAASAPELQRAGGAILAQPAGSGPILIANTGKGYVALQAQCPHAGCDLSWVPEDREAECPCHGSRFAADGSLLNPPARSDVSAYPASADANGDVVVQLFAGDGTFKNPVSGGHFSFSLDDFPVLRNPGGAIGGRPEGFPTPLVIARLSATQDATAIAVLSAICTHLGCTVLPQGGSRILCPCHGSAFALDGSLLSGPASFGLTRYAAQFDGVNVTVSTTPLT